MKIIWGLMLFFVLALNSCTDKTYQLEPVGIDEHEEALKKSPCACLEVKMIRELPDFMFDGSEV